MSDLQYAELADLLVTLMLIAGACGAIGAALFHAAFAVLERLFSGAPMPLTVEQEEKLIARIRATAAYERSRKSEASHVQ